MQRITLCLGKSEKCAEICSVENILLIWLPKNLIIFVNHFNAKFNNHECVE